MVITKKFFHNGQQKVVIEKIFFEKNVLENIVNRRSKSFITKSILFNDILQRTAPK